MGGGVSRAVLCSAPCNSLCSAARHQRASRAGLSVTAVLSGHAPLPYRATACSKLLFLWDKIEKMPPYVHIFNCLLHGVYSRVSLCVHGRQLCRPGLAPRVHPAQGRGLNEGPATVSTIGCSSICSSFSVSKFKIFFLSPGSPLQESPEDPPTIQTYYPGLWV